MQPDREPTTAAQPLATVWHGLTASSRAEIEAKWPRLHDAIDAATRPRKEAEHD